MANEFDNNTNSNLPMNLNEQNNGSYTGSYDYNNYNGYNNQNYTNYQYTDKNAPETPEEKRKGNMFSAISLACSVGSKIMAGLFSSSSGLFDSLTTGEVSSGIISILSVFFAAIAGLGNLAAFVLMIYVRVKYPKNTFGKVLMWLYIIGLIFYILAIILAVVMCAMCLNTIQSCPG